MKKQLTIRQFCDKHNACVEGREWALANCKTMRGAWRKLRPDWLIWVATRPGVLTDRELRLFACWSVRKVWHLLADERSRKAVEVAERFAEGQATKEELAAASAAAWAAAWAAASAAASAAAWAATWAAASAASAAAWDAARDGQVEWLRVNTKPNFYAAGRGEGSGNDSRIVC